MYSEGNKDINWNNVIEKEAVGMDGLDLGKVKQVGDTFIITEKGLINKKKYHLPISSVENFENEVLKLKINEMDLQSYQQTEDTEAIESYSSFKSSDMSKELETQIPLISEKLEVSKKVVEDSLKIVKEPVKETKTAQIELTHEKVTIEKRPVANDNWRSDNSSSSIKDSNAGLSTDQSSQESAMMNGPVDSKTEITIQIKREEPVITKKSFVREEVIVKKKPVTETKTVTEEIINEEIKYDDKLIEENKNKQSL